MEFYDEIHYQKRATASEIAEFYSTVRRARRRINVIEKGCSVGLKMKPDNPRSKYVRCAIRPSEGKKFCALHLSVLGSRKAWWKFW